MVEPDLKCPACTAGNLESGSDELDVPHFGKVVHYYMRCNSCGYRVNDFAFQGDFPKEDKVEIKNKTDLQIKIVRGSKGTIVVPELGLELYPGPLAETFITNVEGLLNRFLNLMPLFDDQRKIEEVQENVGKAIEGSLKITISISDPSGVSHFIRNPQTDIS
ncbi:MAG: ZPR1 zinc finger domain-containing protein [Thermoplasmatales archaeon]|nr:ZPR1 zinc finger domain-containing protein [Thermoplasmatales archaeon]